VVALGIRRPQQLRHRRRAARPDRRGGKIGLALDAWPFVSLTCAAAIALLVIGVTRAGALLAAFAALAAGTVGGVALTVRSGFTVAPARLGPAVTVAGAATTLLVAMPVIILGRTR
jgi:hypothetical protein